MITNSYISVDFYFNRIYKPFFVFFYFIFSVNTLFALNASDVATINYDLVFNLHPKMSLFDFDRIGFYRVELGLGVDEFKKATEELKAKPRDNSKEISKLKEELDKTIDEAAKYQREYIYELDDLKKVNSFVNNMKEYASKKEEIQNQIDTLEWESRNSDLTTRKETLATLKEIRTEIDDIIKDVVKEKNYTMCLNTSILAPYKFNYQSIEFVGYQGIPSVNLDLYHAFDKRKIEAKPKIKNDDFATKRYYELTGLNEDTLPITNHPIVLSGGKSISVEVVKRIYKKHNISGFFVDLLPATIERIEVLQFGKEIEKLEIREKTEN